MATLTEVVEKWEKANFPEICLNYLFEYDSALKHYTFACSQLARALQSEVGKIQSGEGVAFYMDYTRMANQLRELKELKVKITSSVTTFLVVTGRANQCHEFLYDLDTLKSGE